MSRQDRLAKELGREGSAIVDKYGHITDPRVRATYDRICDSPRGLRCRWERVDSAEAYLRLVLCMEAKASPETMQFLRG